ncbi:hypothetical protein CRUP_006516 [Coryphaenoides rupestris]|nr:hypothetical protein CRUP_006516 [Coryphaenoides rupestris]
MLQQILKDMYIDPDVLDALSEDQKKTLFLKMRQEQVRRWKEREEKAEREESGLGEPPRIKPKRANAKSVTWQLGRDGDIAVIVIGEVDEFKTSKIICSGFAEKKVPALLNHASQSGTGLKSNLVQRTTPDPARTGRENLPPKTQHTAPPNAKESAMEVSSLPPLQVSLTERVSPSAALDNKGVASQLRPGAAHVTTNHVTTHAKTGPPPTAPVSTAAVVAADVVEPVPVAAPRACYQRLKLQMSDAQEPRPRDDNQAVDSAPPACAGRGRVAQLMKTFNAESPSAPGHAPSSSSSAVSARTPKPPLPSKPSHLRLMKSSSVR